MDRFELNWPGADASFYTDGWRCRIVWREKGRRPGAGGMGGTIDNNQQCVKRAAESLEGAPYFLNALKARGHARLAEQIESAAAMAGGETPPADRAQPARSPRREPAAERPAPKRVERREGTAVDRSELRWLNALEGDAGHDTVKDKRSKTWFELGSPTRAEEVLLLKAPAARGKAEWVLKRTWPEDAKRKAEFVVAGSFKGIACHLLEAGLTEKGVEQVLSALSGVEHPELVAAARAWRAEGDIH